MSTENKKVFVLTLEGKPALISHNLAEIVKAVACLINTKCENILTDYDSGLFSIKMNNVNIECDISYVSNIINNYSSAIKEEGGKNFNISVTKNKYVCFNISQMNIV